MRLINFTLFQEIANASLFVSFALHLLVLVVLIKSGFQGIEVANTLETSVYFEPASETVSSNSPPTVPLSEQISTVASSNSYKKNQSLLDEGFASIKPKDAILKSNAISQEDRSLKRFITAPREIKSGQPDLKGFLKGDHKKKPLASSMDSVKSNVVANTPMDVDGQEEIPAPPKSPHFLSPGGVERERQTGPQIAGKTPDQRSVSTNNSLWKKKNELVVYRNIIARLITANWTVPPVSISEFQILVSATIDHRGNLIKTKIIESSGLAILDAAAERAIRVSVPFPEFPSTFDPELEFFEQLLRFTPDQVRN